MKAKCIIDHEHYWLKNGEIYDVKEYKKDKKCFEVIDKQNPYEYEIFYKALFELIEEPKIIKQKKPKFKREYLDKIFKENKFETPNDVYEFLLKECE